MIGVWVLVRGGGVGWGGCRWWGGWCLGVGVAGVGGGVVDAGGGV